MVMFFGKILSANKKQDKCYLGAELNNGTLVIGGSSTSDINGDKTLPRMSVSEISDMWFVGLEPTGSIDWQIVLGGTQYELTKSIVATNDGGFIVSGDSESGVSGNKTVASLGVMDTWVIKMAGDCLPSPELCNTLDDNCNGLIDDDVIETISITATGATEFCQGGSVILNATYSGTSVQWQKNGVDIPGAITSSYTATTKGNYSCITTSDCNSATSEPIFVNVFKNPKAIISAAGPTTFCVGESVTLNVSPVAGCSYQWYKDALPIPGATATNYLATTAGIYKCKITKIVTGCYKKFGGYYSDSAM
ncbi:MAG: immunoglobulin domain-containing protein [Bacteroidetes bacterium]|nr:immunoglobulin domain-containing protein [Bacteroidota bacterium]